MRGPISLGIIKEWRTDTFIIVSTYCSVRRRIEIRSALETKNGRGNND